MPPVFPPMVGRDDEYFWNGVKEGKLLLQRCSGCGKLRQPPSPMCGDCGSLEWDTLESSGRGTVYTWILSHHPNQPEETPRIVALIELEEGVRFVSNLIDLEPGQVRNDMPVEVSFEELEAYEGTVVLPQFRAVGA